ncbi:MULTISPECIES: SDR family oxidoreductase [unclassified Brevundimonas]|uniref:SDR family oxidoreductase n=1 Tax=unclassified Brevundimonas TaxID=2622653 RepID=UPI0007001CD2|nr:MULTISPECIES: SDR family oxidoreductase [unclassified Brevundimonas]KQY87236.1 short-chain dehydrogenase [Brevundimonas sp. Root1423]KRA26461.1 short-chain dehydrogenase [Brevundimonas sp. Root608]
MTDHPVRSGAALVTGGGKRIGRAICLELASAGFDVAIHHRNSDDEAAEVARAVEALGRRAVTLSADLADAVATHDLVGRAAEALGPLSVLVNNASVFADDRLDTITGETWSAHLDVNLRAPVLLAQVFAREAPDGSAIVNILDQRVLKPDPRFFSYGLSKSALWFATRTMAQALAPRIRVNGVGPGPTLPSVHQTPDDFAAEAGATLLERPGSPEAVARTVRWLVDAELVTGQMIAVDGGQHLAWRTPDIVE